MRRSLTTLALLALALFTMLAPTPASAASTVDVTSATLVARGVAVDLTLTVACPAGSTGAFELNLRQRSGNGVAYGSGWAPVSCTGQPQEVTGRVAAQPDGAIFRPGETLVTASLELCGSETCEYLFIEDAVRVTH
ncbi:hypothetical protein GA0070606_5292 [Micromonospora citrea]|uniref:Uncharacterized protein n=1 Tax=Micromonospora citrea TaxID=47855 RepID=A0A1C6VUS2_9ACTN|nr:hypothetical protein [Micromonospora citrea]SCL70098.1 hypothetical protein GA0070606_5292 [Micromonospora citrea]